MPHPPPPAARLKKLFQRRKCWMLADLAQALDYALISVRRFLNQIGYCRSYTHNGKWYILRTSPAFNQDGLWRHRRIGFSKRGSLTATICDLVGRSPAGLSAGKLAQKLQHPCHAVLTHLHQNGKLDRVKAGGQFRYLSTEEKTNRRQREQAAVPPPPRPSTSLSTPAALLMLVEHIKHPDLSWEQLAANLQSQGQQNITAESIRRFFEAHALKKTHAAQTPAP